MTLQSIRYGKFFLLTRKSIASHWVYLSMGIDNTYTNGASQHMFLPQSSFLVRGSFHTTAKRTQQIVKF